MINIKCNNVDFKYKGKITAIRNLTLDIHKNEIIGLIGPNGAGKSTLAKIIAGLINPTSGDLFLNDKNYKQMSIFEISKEIGYLFQNPDIMLCTSSVYDEISIGLKIRELPDDEINKITIDMLRFFDLFEKQKFHPRNLSQGEKRRVNLGFVLASNPKIIILDEPFAGLDHYRKNKLLSYLKKLKSKHTIILISHDIDSVMKFCNRIIILNNGEKIFDDLVENLKENSEILLKNSLKFPFFLRLLDRLHSKGINGSLNNLEKLKTILEEKLKSAT